MNRLLFIIGASSATNVDNVSQALTLDMLIVSVGLYFEPDFVIVTDVTVILLLASDDQVINPLARSLSSVEALGALNNISILPVELAEGLILDLIDVPPPSASSIQLSRLLSVILTTPIPDIVTLTVAVTPSDAGAIT